MKNIRTQGEGSRKCTSGTEVEGSSFSFYIWLLLLHIPLVYLKFSVISGASRYLPAPQDKTHHSAWLLFIFDQHITKFYVA